MTTSSDYGAERISIVNARAKLTQLPEILAADNRALALTRHGKPVLAVMSWELFQAIVETMEIMGDPEMMAALRRGIADVEEGNLASMEEVKSQLGLDP